MSEGIVPLRRRGKQRTALDGIDAAAVDLLVGGQTTNLRVARAEVILADMRAQRDHMSAVLADLRSREPSGNQEVDDSNGKLVAAINEGVVQIDLFIARARVSVAEAAQSEPNQSEAPE
jgi:hypothetical protein